MGMNGGVKALEPISALYIFKYFSMELIKVKFSYTHTLIKHINILCFQISLSSRVMVKC